MPASLPTAPTANRLMNACQWAPAPGYSRLRKEDELSMMRLKTRRTRSTLMLIAGVLFLAIGLLSVLLSLAMILDPGDGGQGTVRSGMWFGSCCFLLFVVPGITLVVISQRWRKRANRLQTIRALATTHARLTYHDIAQHLDIPASRVPALMLEAVDIGLVRGRLDGEHQTFVSGNVSDAVQEVHADCASCGATGVRVQVHAGGVARCPYCGAPLH